MQLLELFCLGKRREMEQRVRGEKLLLWWNARTRLEDDERTRPMVQEDIESQINVKELKEKNNVIKELGILCYCKLISLEKGENLPSRFHQTGQPDANLTAPVANIKRKSNQRILQKVTASLGLLIFPFGGVKTGAIRTQRKPASSSKVSLDKLIKRKTSKSC